MGFIAEPPLRTARRYTEADLTGKARPSELRWLHDHPVWWLRALMAIEHDVNNRIAKSRKDLAKHRPMPGQSEHDYLAVKRGHDAQTLHRLHFKRLVDRRKEEVVSLFGPHPATRGDIIRAFIEITLFIDEDDTQAVRDMALYWAERLGKEAAS